MDWNCAATCIGSLPHHDAAEAVDMIVSRRDLIPFWPQLPALGFDENMYAQYAVRLPGVRMDPENQRITVDLDDYDPMEFYTMLLSEEMDYFAMDLDHFRGYEELMSRDLRSSVIKGQVTGPVSEGLQVLDANGKPVLYDESYCEIMRKGLNMTAKWQQARLAEVCDSTIIFIDEPSLSLMGTPFASVSSEQARAWIDDVLDGIEGHTAIHCCGNTDWPTVLATRTDIVSIDAYTYGHTIALYDEETAAFLERGGSVAWGIVPNTSEALDIETPDTLMGLLEKHVRALADKGIDEDLVWRSSMLTPQCGLGGLDVRDAERAVDMLLELSSLIRETRSLGRA